MKYPILPMAPTASSLTYVLILLVFLAGYSCNKQSAVSEKAEGSHQKMIAILAEVNKQISKPENDFASETRLEFVDSLIKVTNDPNVKLQFQYKKAGVLLENGMEIEAVALYEQLGTALTQNPQTAVMYYMDLGVAYLRLAERNSCIGGHNADACILPFQGRGIHQDKTPARGAINAFTNLLKLDPKDLDGLWLLNIAYMTVGEYPSGVPKAWLIPGIDAPGEKVNAFVSIAPDLDIATNSCSGGSIIEDFNNDGLYDIVTSSWRLFDAMSFYINKGDGTFENASISSKLAEMKGGLNMTTTDYNNDGFIDIYVMRGAWQGVSGFGEQPNSLLKNNGDGTFTDVTIDAGLLSYKPTQSVAWNDYNNDGWLDVFVANESSASLDQYPCELFINNRNGTFTDMAPKWGVNFGGFMKGVTSGDYNNDGWADLFFSTMNGEKMLLKNHGMQNGVLVFENATQQAGLGGEIYRSFPTWFFDYNNDGWLDIFVCNYEFERPLSYYFAKEMLKPSNDATGKPRMYRNNQDGTFTNVSEALQLNKPAFAMGANFGDIDNDGWLDFYLGTGNPSYKSLVPNKLFRNVDGKRFADVTNSSRTGNLQKGHGVSFADLDNDGDQDIHVDMGGALKGDAYPTQFYLNPGQNSKNNWIYLKLVGDKSNKAAIGAKIAVTFTENGKKRTVYRDVNSGGSFGSSPLRREIGIGEASVVDEVVVSWPASRTQQAIKNLKANQLYLIKEGENQVKPQSMQNVVFKHTNGKMPMCYPQI